MIRNATVFLISLHEHYKVNICVTCICLVSSGLRRMWRGPICSVCSSSWNAGNDIDTTKRRKFHVKVWLCINGKQQYSSSILFEGVKTSRQECMNTVGCPFKVLSGTDCAWVGSPSEALVHNNRCHGLEIQKNQGLSQCSCRIFRSTNSNDTVGKALITTSPSGRGFDSQRCHWNFWMTYSYRSHYGPGFDSASNRNEYQADRLRRCHEIWATPDP